MSEYESPIVDSLNSDGAVPRGTAVVGETFFASQLYMVGGVAAIVLYLAAFVLPVRSVGESNEDISSTTH